MHELKYLKKAKRRRAYCICGWVQPEWSAVADSDYENAVDAQSTFIEHLMTLPQVDNEARLGRIHCEDCGDSLKSWDAECSCDWPDDPPKEVPA